MRTKNFEYILNLASPLPYPVSNDIAQSPSWKAIESAKASLGPRSIDAFLHRPAEELYDLEHDPDEVHNIASDPAFATTLDTMRAALSEFRRKTHDPWLEGSTSAFSTSHHDE